MDSNIQIGSLSEVVKIYSFFKLQRLIITLNNHWYIEFTEQSTTVNKFNCRTFQLEGLELFAAVTAILYIILTCEYCY